jgi:hypothetical protein
MNTIEKNPEDESRINPAHTPQTAPPNPARADSKPKRLTREQRAAISRANGAKSRGPVSREGMNQCTAAKLRHGMLARTVVLPTENTERFRDLLRQLEAEFQPETPNEFRLVEAMAAASWRQARAWSLEKSLLSYELRQQVITNNEIAGEDEPTRTSATVRHLADNSHCLDLIHRCEMGFVRQYQRLQATLQASKAARRTASAAAQEVKVLPTC